MKIQTEEEIIEERKEGKTTAFFKIVFGGIICIVGFLLWLVLMIGLQTVFYEIPHFLSHVLLKWLC